MKAVWKLLRRTFSEFGEDRATIYAAALSYSALFALAPLLIFAIAIAGFVFDREAVQQQVLAQFGTLVGAQAEEQLATMLENADRLSADRGAMATVVAAGTLLVGASGVFGLLHEALNRMWDVRQEAQGVLGTIRRRFLSFTLVLGTGFLLLVSLIISAGLAAFNTFLTSLAPGVDVLWQVVNLVVSLGVIALLFALIFKVVPDAEVDWRDVWVGAFVTAVLFSLGRIGIGLYLGQAAIASAYGAAGSLVLLLVWIYYSALILFAGAEFTQVYANTYGSRVRPELGAVRVRRK